MIPYPLFFIYRCFTTLYLLLINIYFIMNKLLEKAGVYTGKTIGTVVGICVGISEGVKLGIKEAKEELRKESK